VDNERCGFLVSNKISYKVSEAPEIDEMLCQVLKLIHSAFECSDIEWLHLWNSSVSLKGNNGKRDL
jgi:hypothetical protein